MKNNANFIFKMLNKKIVFFSLFILLILDLIYMFIPFSFTLFLTTPFTLKKAIIIVTIFIISKFSRTFLLYFWRRFTDRYLYKYSCDQMLEYFKKIIKIPVQKLAKYQTGYIENIINNITLLTKELLTEDYMYILLGLIFFYYTVFTQSIAIGALCITIGIICVIISIITLKKANKSLDELYSEENKYSANYQDFISNIRTVKTLNNDSYFINKIENMNNKRFNKAKTYIKYYSFEELLRNCLIILPFSIALIKAVVDLSNGIDTLGIITFYIAIFAEMNEVFNGLSGNLINWFKLKTLKKQAQILLKDNLEKEYIRNFNTYEITNSKIKHENSNFEINIQNFSFYKNETIIISGKSGEGKTSLLNLIIGNIKNDSTILFDGKKQNKDIDAGFVSQEIELFNTTIRDNLCMGKKINEKKLIQYINELDLNSLIHELENGLDTIVGEKGLKLSTGQKRRINILRSLLEDKNIYLLDEPTSNLDNKTKKIVINFIKKYFKDKTLIISTHDNELINISDKHYLMENHSLKRI